MSVNWDRCPRPLWQHQREGVETLLTHPAFALWDEVGVGKSAQVVTTACHLHSVGEIDAVIIVCPAFVRSVWASPDPILGEFAKWAWPSTSVGLSEYSTKSQKLPTAENHDLKVVVTNYEFLRVVQPDSKPSIYTHLRPLVEWALKRKTWLICDESWAVENPQSKQAKAIYLLRQACDRVTLLNGTPGPPEKLFSQFQILDADILGVKNFFHFRSKYCVMGGRFKKIVGYQRMDDFQARTAPHALLRKADDCLDLPEVLPPLTIEAQLTPKTWAIYSQMRDEMIAFLESGDASVAAQAGVRSLRLSQILAGFIGGVETQNPDLLDEPLGPVVREVGREKLDATRAFLSAQDLKKVVIWTKFRDEAARFHEQLQTDGRPTYLLVGQQKDEDRSAAKRVFAPGTPDTTPAVLIGHPAAGGAGINLSAASIAIYATNGYSLKDRQQSEGRLQRPGQTTRVRFVDVVAVGPKGQKTLDHAILHALRDKLDIATWTAATWRRALTEE